MISRWCGPLCAQTDPSEYRMRDVIHSHRVKYAISDEEIGEPMIVTQKHLPRRAFLRGAGVALGAAVSRRDGAGVRQPRQNGGRIAGAHGLCLRSERHHRIELAALQRRQRLSSSTSTMKALEPFREAYADAQQSGADQRPVPGRWRRGSRARRRQLADRRSSEEDRGRRYSLRNFRRPDRGAGVRQADAVRLARDRRGSAVVWRADAIRDIAAPIPTPFPGAVRPRRIRWK